MLSGEPIRVGTPYLLPIEKPPREAYDTEWLPFTLRERIVGPTYTSPDPHTEVIGQNVLSFVQNVNANVIRPVLDSHGLSHIEPDKWYPLQRWRNVLSDLAGESNAMFNMVAVGMAISETAVLPPGAEQLSLEQILFAINDIYQLQHHGQVGSVRTEKISDKHLKLTVCVPYPDDLEYGTTYGFARRFLPKGTLFTVEYDQDLPRHDQGGDSTVIHITWE